MNERYEYLSGREALPGDVVMRGGGRALYQVLSLVTAEGEALALVSSLQRSRPHGRAPMTFMEPVGRLSLIERAS